MLFNGTFLPARNNRAYREALGQPSAWGQFYYTSEWYFFFAFLMSLFSFKVQGILRLGITSQSINFFCTVLIIKLFIHHKSLCLDLKCYLQYLM